MLLIYIIITTRPIIENVSIDDNTNLIVGIIIVLLICGIGFFSIIWDFIKNHKVSISMIMVSMPWILAWFFVVKPNLFESKFSIVAYSIALISIILITILTSLMPKRTPFGNEILGKLKGFKRFLEIAEKSQLEMLVADNPEYFYNILPYTYALDVSDIWVKQFENIAIAPPSWYSGTGDFSMHTFGTFMSSTMASATTAMSSSPSSGGGSGGGSSGGGSGGGGGGSW